MHLPALANLSSKCLATIIAGYNTNLSKIYSIFCFFGSHSFPYQSLLLGTNIPNDNVNDIAMYYYYYEYCHVQESGVIKYVVA